MAWKAYNTVNGQILGETSASGARPTDYLTDALGSVVATVSKGTIQNTYRWAGYGQQVSKTGASPDPKFLWVGGWGYRAAASLVFARNRHVDRFAGRWLTADPSLFEDLPYCYVECKPTTWIDPLGLQGGPPGTVIPPPTTLPPPWFPPGPTPVGPPVPVKPPCPAPAILARVCIIAGGIWACYEICTYEPGAPSGPLTELGECIGKSLFPDPKDMPPETPECPKPPKPRATAEARRLALLQNFGKCNRFHKGNPGPATSCPAGGTHQTDLYWCKKGNDSKKKVSASVVCCFCRDKKGISEYCFASVHVAMR